MKKYKFLQVLIVLLVLVLLGVILVFGKPFLMPLTFAALLAMSVLPLSRWLERKKLSRGLSSLLSLLLILVLISGIVALISWQASNIFAGASDLKSKLGDVYQQVREMVSERLGVSRQEQEQMIKEQKASSPGKLSGVVTQLVMGIGGLLTNLVIVSVYIFLMLLFRHRIRRFLIRLAPPEHHQDVASITERSQQITQKYLSGYAMMIFALWIMYGIGFSIVGVKNALFFAMLCGVLEIIPFVGNLAGTALTVIMSLLDGGGSGVILGILITYLVVQFIQTYLLEPLVVGKEVDINPLATVAGLVAGEMIWGIGGIVLAIPVLGILKVACERFEILKPVAELIGEDSKKGGGLKDKFAKLKRRLRT